MAPSDVTFFVKWQAYFKCLSNGRPEFIED